MRFRLYYRFWEYEIGRDELGMEEYGGAFGGKPGLSRCCSAMQVWMAIIIYRVSQEEWTKLRESVPYVELYRYNSKHLYPKLNGYGDNGQRSLKL